MALPVSGHWWRGRPGAATRKLSPTCGLRVSLMTKSDASSKCMVDLFGCNGSGDYVNRSSRLKRVLRMKDDVKQPPIKVTFYWINMSSRTVAGGLLPVSTHQCLCLSARFTKILIPTPVHHAKLAPPAARLRLLNLMMASMKARNVEK